ncbi:hypothetical protein [Vibrio rotiferianus]|uniref:hypothetical protein n=1 Tax=Vibrio rotiferianus TaxID=190895 RepID=UPI00023771E3|nr:hypothetical protein [Vibrio rotiferianus]
MKAILKTMSGDVLGLKEVDQIMVDSLITFDNIAFKVSHFSSETVAICHELGGTGEEYKIVIDPARSK